MERTLNYKITFHSPWHCGAGLSAGAELDALTVKDDNGMPFIPGKTLKGLIREAAEDYVHYAGLDPAPLKRVFGDGSDEDGLTGCAHFGDATLCPAEYEAIIEGDTQAYLYNKVSSTAIGDDGLAVAHSLRSVQTVVPCTLQAAITGVPTDFYDTLVSSLGLIKRMGLKRNRGLGRCDFKEGGEL